MNMIEKRRRMRGQGGFTLIELLVVIAILAVLAGVVVFAVNGINNNSQESACEIDLRTLKTAVGADIAQNPQTADQATDEAELVTRGLLDSESTNYSWTSAGGYVVENTGPGPLVALRYFGPDVHDDLPVNGRTR
ncbi:MAG: type II secretion system protein [Planctomycetia bacterium]